MIESSPEQTAVLSLCHFAAGAVGRRASREKSDRQAVLCGPGLWKRPAGPHTDQRRGELGAAFSRDDRFLTKSLASLLRFFALELPASSSAGDLCCIFLPSFPVISLLVLSNRYKKCPNLKEENQTNSSFQN